MWVNATSLPQDWELTRAWEVVQARADGAGIPLIRQHRLTARLVNCRSSLIPSKDRAPAAKRYLTPGQ